jgi:hypothetical protein
MGKLKKFWYKVFDVLDDILAYILTIIGILCSNYLPLLKSNGIIDISIDWWRIGLAAVVALMIIGKQETLEIDENGTTEKSKQGRRKRFALRMINSLSQGVLWNQIIQLAT